jgi:hypothetical protein
VSAHTPGPWHFIGDALTHRSFNIYQAGEWAGMRHVATVNNLPVALLWKRDAEEALANARLIAEAPAMFEALASISLMENETTSSAAEKVRSAVAKAREVLLRVRGTR